MDFDILTAGIDRVTVGEGMVHLTLLKASVVGEEENELVHEVILSPTGFLNLVEQVEGTVQELKDKGLLSDGGEQ